MTWLFNYCLTGLQYRRRNAPLFNCLMQQCTLDSRAVCENFFPTSFSFVLLLFPMWDVCTLFFLCSFCSFILFWNESFDLCRWNSADTTIWRVEEMMTIYFVLFYFIYYYYDPIFDFSSLPFPSTRPFFIREREREKLPPESLLYVFTYSIAYSPGKEKRGTCVCGWIPVMSPFQMIFYFLFYITPGLYSLALRCV